MLYSGYCRIILSLSILCYSEKLFRTMTDLVISEGYAAAGYEYINVDDCWLDFARSYDGRLQPDAKRFPRGMADLSEYVSTLNNIYFFIIGTPPPQIKKMTNIMTNQKINGFVYISLLINYNIHALSSPQSVGTSLYRAYWY